MHDTQRRKRSPVRVSGNAYSKNILKLEVLGNGISGILRPNQRVIMSRFWEGLIVSFADARA